MEILENKIKKFIAIDTESDNASGYGNSSGAGLGFGLCDGTGYNYGCGNA